jgi:hypothetical protein
MAGGGEVSYLQRNREGQQRPVGSRANAKHPQPGSRCGRLRSSTREGVDSRQTIIDGDLNPKP